MENCFSVNQCGIFYFISIIAAALIASILLVGGLSLHDKTKSVFPFKRKVILSVFLLILGVRVVYKVITISFM
ncbi:MAG: hypothetical protein HW387_1030 [Parachlamydiales bacterium]|nr:hypothetical protein [Parachlamydiales bacterium]